MNNAKIVKKIIADLQGVLTEATDQLDRISQYEENDFSIEACCYNLLKKYQGHAPTDSDVLTFKTAIELTLHNDYGIPMDKFD